VATDQLTVIVDPDPEFTFFVPNAFTPNKDGINDFLFVFSSELLLIDQLLVFDRWGNTIYNGLNLQPDAITSGWDGTFNNNKVNSGVYAWSAQLTFRGGFKKQVFGNVTVLE
ncbi:MAG: gliding motility-associated C-terminal domain-containing protein, partial [Chitinophagales bacterium]